MAFVKEKAPPDGQGAPTLAAVYCGHANENPKGECDCPSNCYCRREGNCPKDAPAEHVHTDHCKCPDKPSFLPPKREPTAPANNTHKLKLGEDEDLLAAIRRFMAVEGRSFNPQDYAFLINNVSLRDHNDADKGIGIGDITIEGTYVRSKDAVYNAAQALANEAMLHHALLKDCLKYMMERGPKKGKFKEQEFEKLVERIVKATKGKSG